jgi:hypothetical protein
MQETEGMMKGPDGTILRFFYDTARNETATIAEGRPIFDTVLMVDVITPGQRTSTPRFELERTWAEQSIKALGLNTSHKRSLKYRLYEEQIERFKANEKGSDLGGTPLKEWPRIDRGLAASLAAANIYTVEAVADLPDSRLDVLGLGGRAMREQARSYLAAAAGDSGLSEMTERATRAEAEVQQLKADLLIANSRIAEMEKPPRGGKAAASPSPPSQPAPASGGIDLAI